MKAELLDGKLSSTRTEPRVTPNPSSSPSANQITFYKTHVKTCWPPAVTAESCEEDGEEEEEDEETNDSRRQEPRTRDLWPQRRHDHWERDREGEGVIVIVIIIIMNILVL